MRPVPIGELISEWRRRRGLSQVELQQRANLSSSSIISRAELGTTVPTAENMRAIARALGAESSLMAAHAELTQAQSHRAVLEFAFGSVRSLLASPLLLVTLPDFDLMVPIRDAAEADDPDSPGTADPAQIERMLFNNGATAVLRPRATSGGAAPAFHVATLACEFDSAALDVILPAVRGGRPQVIGYPQFERMDDVPTPMYRQDGGEIHALAGTGQILAAPAGPAAGAAATPSISLAPYTAEHLHVGARGVERAPTADSGRVGSRRVTVELEIVVASDHDFKAQQARLTPLLEQLASASASLSAPGSELHTSAALLERAEGVFEVPRGDMARFLRIAAPTWRLWLSLAWLRSGRPGSRSSGPP